MNRLMSTRATNILLAVAVALLAGNLAISGQRATASIENVQIGQIRKQATPQAENEPEVPVEFSFTYQGRLKDGPNPANGQYDFLYKLFDAETGGTQIGTTISRLNQAVSEGLVTVNLNFGQAFQGETRYLDVAVRQSGAGGYTPLTPRQPVTPAPYSHFSQDVQPHDNVVVVAKSGGDFTTITAALNSVADNSGNNRYVVRVGPGVYNETVQMKPFVDIEGSGELNTKISFAGSPSLDTGTVLGANNAELRFLTVENTGSSEFAIAIYNGNTSPRMLHVTANASNAVTENHGVRNVNQSFPNMTWVTAQASTGTGTASLNAGVYNDHSTPNMTNVKASGVGGGAFNYGVFNSNSGPFMTNVLAGASSGNANYGVYEQSQSLSRMTNVTATAVGGNGSSNFGVVSADSSPILTGVTANASGGVNSHNHAVIIQSPTGTTSLADVTAVASGGSGSENTGVRSDSASLTVNGGSIRASGGSTNYALFNNANGGSFTVTIDNSTLSGSTNTIRSDAEFATRVGASKLAGGPVSPNAGTITCAGVHDENYGFFASTCP